MRVAHIAIATPKRCGLYETARELVSGERAIGVDARIVDPRPIPALHPGDSDRGVPLADMDWAVQADVIVSHSGHDETPVAETDQPIIHACHGRPLSTFIGEHEGGAPAYSYYVTRSKQDRYVGAVTFWPEYEPYLRALWRPKPVCVIPPTVDAEYWHPGPTGYDFAGKAGGFNVVMCDPWSRPDTHPLHTIHAFELFRHIRPDANLHIFAATNNLKGYQALFRVLGDSLGLVQGWAADLRPVYRAADMLITPHRILTRSVREAQACGCRVVTGAHRNPEDIEAFAMAMAACADAPPPVPEMTHAECSPTRAAREMRKAIDQMAGVACGD